MLGSRSTGPNNYHQIREGSTVSLNPGVNKPRSLQFEHIVTQIHVSRKHAIRLVVYADLTTPTQLPERRTCSRNWCPVVRIPSESPCPWWSNRCKVQTLDHQFQSYRKHVNRPVNAPSNLLFILIKVFSTEISLASVSLPSIGWLYGYLEVGNHELTIHPSIMSE